MRYIHACSFDIVCAAPIEAGFEVTISYGSNKSNLALLSCYGFFTSGNTGDAQLLRPIAEGCLAAADGLAGFDQELVVAAAAAAAGLTHHDRQQQDDVQIARRKCAVAALPVSKAATGANGSSEKEALQLQQYAAQLLLYQVRQLLRLCGTTVEEDAAMLEGLPAAADHGLAEDALAAAVDRTVIAARLEQKLLLQECEVLAGNLVECTQQRLREL
jgi:hypothetical protein